MKVFVETERLLLRELQKEDVGVIEVKDTTSYVAVARNKVNAVLRKLQNEKLKGKKVKMEVAY